MILFSGVISEKTQDEVLKKKRLKPFGLLQLPLPYLQFFWEYFALFIMDHLLHGLLVFLFY